MAVFKVMKPQKNHVQGKVLSQWNLSVWYLQEDRGLAQWEAGHASPVMRNKFCHLVLRAGKRIINHCSEHLHLIVFTTLHGFCFHLLFSRTPRRYSSYLYLHFIAKETKAKEVNTLLKATMLVKRSQFQSQVPGLQDMGFMFPHSPYTTPYVNGMSHCFELIRCPARGLGQVPAASLAADRHSWAGQGLTLISWVFSMLCLIWAQRHSPWGCAPAENSSSLCSAFEGGESKSAWWNRRQAPVWGMLGNVSCPAARVSMVCCPLRHQVQVQSLQLGKGDVIAPN